MVRKYASQNSNKYGLFKESSSVLSIPPEGSISMESGGAIRYRKPKEEFTIEIEKNNNLKTKIETVGEQELRHYYNALTIEININQWINVSSHEKNITLLHLAAQDGNVSTIKTLIKRGVKFTKDIDGKTPLHYAAVAGKRKALETIIKKLKCGGSEINKQDKDGNTPLHYASNEDCVRFLVENGARMIRNNQGHTPLHTFAIKGLKECVEYFLSHLNTIRGLDTRDDENCTLLHYAVKSGVGINFIRYLHKKGLTFVDDDELIADNNGKSLLFYAAMNGNYQYFIDFYTLLITIPGFNSEFEIGRKDKDGATILHHTAQSDEEDLLKFIIEQGIKKGNPVHLNDGNNFVIKDLKGCTLLHYAAQSKRDNSLKFLINQLEKSKGKYKIALEQEVNMLDEYGMTPLHYASKEGNWECIELLRKKGADIYLVNKNGMNPLHIASMYGHVSCAELLISHSCNQQDYVNSKTYNGETPLLLAINENHENCAKLLKNAGADIYAYNDIGVTALHYAACGGIECLKLTIEIMKKNLNRVYNINVCDRYGRIPLHFAKNEECFELLVQNGSNFVYQGKLTRDRYGKTILHYVAESGNIGLMEFILKQLEKHKVNVNQEINRQDNSNRMPLCYAVQQKRMEMVELLLNISAQFATEEINYYVEAGIHKLFMYEVKGKDEILHVKDKYSKTVYDYVLESDDIYMLESFLEFSSKMEKLKKKLYYRLDNQFMRKFAHISAVSGFILSLLSMRFYIREDFPGKRELSDFVISINIVLSLLTTLVVFLPEAKQSKLGNIINEYKEEIRKINNKISEIEQEKFSKIQGIEEKLQQYVEAAVGEGITTSVSDDQKKCFDDLKNNNDNKTSLIAQKIFSNLFSNVINKSNRPNPTESWVRAQKLWESAIRKTIDDIRSQKEIDDIPKRETIDDIQDQQEVTRL